MRDQSLLHHETDFFPTAEAESREKLRLALDNFWLWNIPDPEHRAIACELALQENLQRQRLTHKTKSQAVCKGEHCWQVPAKPAPVLREHTG
jgi:hypothetical protein